MTVPLYYLSLQYSAIQKTVLRHDRLWSIAGISQTLAKLNEIKLYEITEDCCGDVIVAGGGKFTASFRSEDSAETARGKIIAVISETLPMLEFQVSEVTEAENLKDARKNKHIIDRLNALKTHFRGYAFTHNPHLELCDECGEYPAVYPLEEGNKETLALCSVCKTARKNCLRSIDKDKNSDSTSVLPAHTTLEHIYRQYYQITFSDHSKWPDIPLDFQDMFPKKDKSEIKKKRMAVWFSDLNNMNDKVPIWLDQDDDEDIVKTFKAVKDVNVEIIVNALCATFKKPQTNVPFLPFRIIVAGGDDLRIVMDEKYILSFAKNISTAVREKINKLPETHQLNSIWLQKRNERKGTEIQPYGFGGSFVVTALHTPFKKIHKLCEDLMSNAKEETQRLDNSLDWCILSEGEADAIAQLDSEKPLSVVKLKAEKPLYIGSSHEKVLDRLSLDQYLKLIEKHKKISPTHRYQIIDKIANLEDDVLESVLRRIASKENDKDFTAMLNEKSFRDDKDKLLTARIVTLFELMSIGEAAEVRR